MNEYQLRCAICGTDHGVAPSAVDDLKSAKTGDSVYICEACQQRVQYDSEQKFK
ncbi:MAG TPA: hypothetical protein VFV52_13420 [Bacilli bacterium]|nr:hypothetical protein [Bacilli bacterium]